MVKCEDIFRNLEAACGKCYLFIRIYYKLQESLWKISKVEAACLERLWWLIIGGPTLPSNLMWFSGTISLWARGLSLGQCTLRNDLRSERTGCGSFRCGAGCFWLWAASMEGGTIGWVEDRVSCVRTVFAQSTFVTLSFSPWVQDLYSQRVTLKGHSSCVNPEPGKKTASLRALYAQPYSHTKQY